MAKLDMRLPVVLADSAPDSTTPGWVGLLVMDTSRSDKPIYKCTNAQNGVYTWKILEGGSGGGGMVDVPDAVLVTPQELSEEQQAQARENIGAASAGVKTASGEVLLLSDSTDTDLRKMVVFGKSTQDGTPSTAAPLEIVSVGDDGAINVFVGGRNLFDSTPSAEVIRDIENATLIETLDNGVIIQGNAGSTPGTNAYSNGWYRPGYHPRNEHLRVWLSAGTTATLSFEYTMLEYAYGDSTNINVTMRNVNEIDIYAETRTISVGVKIQIKLTIQVGIEGYYYLVISANSGKCRIENIQIEIGSTATDYEQYNPLQTLVLATAGGVCGIPVASGGNYTDADGQMWICDEVNFGNGKHVQRVGRIDSYAGESVGDVWISSTGALSSGATVLYLLAEPVEQALSEDELTAYRELELYYPDTTIYTDENAGLYVERAENIKKYVDRKLAELASAIVNN